MRPSSGHHRRPAPLAGLSETEYQICLAIAERRSNREIGQALFLSEGTVKQYVNQIYTKLHLTGAARDKRRLLGELVSPEKLTRGYYLSKTSHRTLSLYGGMFLSRPIGKKRKEEPM